MSYEDVKKVWMNGRLVDFADAKIHAFSHVFHYGSAMFEGARVYKTKHGSAAFRLDEHIKRLYDSCKVYRMEIPYTPKEFTRRDLRDDPRQRLRGVLHPAGRLPRARRPRRQSVQQPGRRHDRGLEMGQVPRRRGARGRRGRLRLLLEPHGAQHLPGHGQGHRQLPELGADQDGGDHQRLHRGHRARQRRPRSPRAAARTSSSSTAAGS